VIGKPVQAIALLTALAGCDFIAGTALNLVETTEFVVEGEALIMNGEINSKTLDQFEEVIGENPQITVLIEENVPGSLDDDTMIPLAYRVRELGLNTHLRATSDERTMEKGAHIGVHSWSDGVREAKDYPKEAPEHEKNRAYIEDMLGSDAFYWFTIYAAPADEIHGMTEDEIIEYGLLTQPILH